jgi:hypothetical protein
MLFILISVLSLDAWQATEAAPGGGGGRGSKADLTTNIQVVDSSSPQVVVGEVIGLDAGPRHVFVVLSPSLANGDPPLVVRVLLQNPVMNQAGVALGGTEALYYTDATCSTTPYFTVPTSVYTPTGVVTISSGVTTSYHIFTPGTGPVVSQMVFSARRFPVEPLSNIGSCVTEGSIHDAIQAEATPYSITLTPPFKLNNP